MRTFRGRPESDRRQVDRARLPLADVVMSQLWQSRVDFCRVPQDLLPDHDELSLLVRDRSSSSSLAAETTSEVWNPSENRE